MYSSCKATISSQCYAKKVLSFRSSLHQVVLQLWVGSEVVAFSMKDMEVGRRWRVCLTEVRRYLADTWTRTDQRAGKQSINLLGEKKRHVTDIFLAQPYNHALPSMFYGSDVDIVCIMNWSYTPACSERARRSAHRLARKLRAWPVPNDTQARKVSFFTLQPVIVLDGKRIGEQWVEGGEGGVQRDHGSCEHRRTAAKATVQLRPEAPGKHSGGISGNSECFILIHTLLRSSGQLWVSNI